MGRKKGLKKTKTIRKRRVDVYLPSLETREEWTKAAEKRGQSVSQMVFDLVDQSLSGETPDTRELQELRTENSDLQERMGALQGRIEDLATLKERLEDELAEYRAEDWNQPLPLKDLDTRIVRILSTATTLSGDHKVVSAAELRKRLRIKPGQVEKLKALDRQLEILELHEFARRTKKGWVWNE